MHIDQNLNWISQIEHIATGLARYCYALRILTRTIGVDAALAAYHAYVQSRLRYGIIFWANSDESDRIFFLQKRCVRNIFNSKFNESCKNVFIGQKILTLYSLFIYECVMYIIINYNDYKTLVLKHEYNTRGKTHLSAEKTTYTYIKKNVTHFIITIWNELPT